MTETRQHKIERIYEVIKPTIFWNTDLDSWHSNWDIKFVMIWDVLDWYNKVFGVDLFFDTIPDEIIILFWDRKQKRKPIEEQSDDTIDYLYSLLPTEDDRRK